MHVYTGFRKAFMRVKSKRITQRRRKATKDREMIHERGKATHLTGG
jgi:hypothetical protein